MRWNPWGVWLGGILAGNVASGALIGVVVGLSCLWPHADKFFVLPSFLLVPLLAGLTGSFVWRVHRPGIGTTAWLSLLLTLCTLLCAALLAGEGWICLIILSPLYYGIVLAGALIGRSLFYSPDNRLPLVVFPLIVLLSAAEIASRQNESGVVSDEILIKAPPAKVWPQLTSFPEIPSPPHFWLFRLGLPYPESTTSQGDFVGAGRECIFSGNAIFKEIVVELEPEKVLTFDIVELPPDPELIGHLTPTRGRFSLKDNGDGTTTLRGDTWYTLHVRPLFYFDWWTQVIFREVHLRVMEDIRRRAENS